MSNNHKVSLLEKLDGFIRKYYTNRMLRGLLYSVGLIVGFYLLVTLLESVGQFGTQLRTLLFWSFAGISLGVLVWYVIIPLSKLFKLGKTLSYEDASLIVGDHFPEVKDKLLNTLQLQADRHISSSDSLLMASIEQRTTELRPVPFTSAIDLGENRKYLKYALPPLLLLVVILFAAPSLITESTDRLLRYNEEIIPVAPFDLELVNTALEIPERSDFTLQVNAIGDVIPEKVYIELNDTRFKLENTSKSSYEYTLRNVNKTQEFRLYADGFFFGPYTLETLAKPVLVNFNVAIDYPSYTGLTDENRSNSGDLTLPEGTRVAWNFQGKNTETIRFAIGDSTYSLEPTAGDRFVYNTVVQSGGIYSIAPSNSNIPKGDSMVYRLNVTPDRYPIIQVEEEQDSLSSKHLFFTGDIQDDYGLRKLTFNYAFTDSENEERSLENYKSIPLVTPAGTADRFFHHWNLEELGIQAGEELSYYFEVWDNDGINGPKSTRSVKRIYAAPSLDEVRDARDDENEDIKDKLEKSIDDAKDLQKDLEDLRKEMLQKEELGWQEKKKLEEALEKQKKLQEQVEQLQQQNEQKNQKQNEFEQQNESIQQKQEQLQKLMEQVMDEELQKLYDEIQKMMEELNKEELQEQVEDMEMSAEDLEKELDRALEQFKQLEYEQKMTETIDELKKLSEEQKELAEETEKAEKPQEELKEKQDELNDEFDKLKEALDDLEKMNEELENPNPMPDTEQEEQSIDEQMQDSSDQLEKKKNKKASESQQNAGEQMEQMAQQMEQSMQSAESEQMEEDLDALRALLENIITLSFDQEQLMGDIKEVDKNDPKYVAYGQVQRKLKDDAKMVEDSLFALSKRIFQLEPIVNREIGLVNEHMGDALDEVGERNTPEVTRHQQYVMTSFNNLALLLDEALQAMQQEMSCNKPGTGNCEKPGGKGAKPSASQMKQMQQQLSKQLEQMKEQMGSQGNKGENKDGQGKMSKELAKMAAKQSAIRQMMDELSQQLNEDGSGNGNQIKEISKEMEKIEEDIVNKRVDQQTIERQQDIMIRLLKAEEAERTRGEDNKRKSRTGDSSLISDPGSMEEYIRSKEKEVELLRTVPPSLKPYYKEKVNEYFNNLDR